MTGIAILEPTPYRDPTYLEASLQAAAKVSEANRAKWLLRVMLLSMTALILTVVICRRYRSSTLTS
ncbi:MAG: hypothetical protein ACI8T1_000606 [Verrucomicrobiales bacterium]|jgi:hypothetical protein